MKMSVFVSQWAVDLIQILPVGIILCDASSSIVFMNDAAQEFIDSCDQLSVHRGSLFGRTPGMTKKLHSCVRHALESCHSYRPIFLTVDTMQSQFLQLEFSRNHKQTITQSLDIVDQKVAVICTFHYQREQRANEALIRRLFQVTQSEARVLASVANGRSIKDAARDIGVTEGTARYYLKQIFSKTDTNRQSELVRHVANSPAWLRHDNLVSPNEAG